MRSHKNNLRSILSSLIAIAVFGLSLFSISAMPTSVQAAPQEKAQTAPAGFAYRCGVHFCKDGTSFYFAGANMYQLFLNNNSQIDTWMTNAQADKIKVIRTWMFSHDASGFNPSRGNYNQATFQKFDYILKAASDRGIKVLPVLENFWSFGGGVDAILSWNGIGGGNSWKFFNSGQCSGCINDYKNYANYALNRVNSITGVAYKNDPTIFAWELMNEPRYQGASPNEDTSGTTMRAWIDNVASYMKGIDPNHMIGIGNEGQMANYSFGGYTGFGSNTGVPFIYTAQSPYIDFAGSHPYVADDWSCFNQAKGQALIAQFISDAHNAVGKPYYMGEFGTKGSNCTGLSKSQWFSAAFSTMESNNGDGDAIWNYFGSSSCNYAGDYDVCSGDPALPIFRTHADNMAAKNGGGGGSNLALNKTTTSSTPCVSPGEASPKAVDGSTSTKWCDNSSASKWLQVDLGTAMNISSIVLKHAGTGGEPTSFNTNAFTLKIGTDGTNWTTVATVSGNTSSTTTHNFTAMSARYILLSITNGGSDGAARIYELEAYGSGSGGPTATPTRTPTPGGGSNLALNKTTTSSTACASPGEASPKAVDGLTTTKWCDNSSASKWIQVDLGSAMTVSSVVLKHAGAGGESSSWNTNAFNIKISTDGINWTTVATVSGNTSNITTHNFTAMSGRYILLSITNAGGDGAARIYEFEVH